MDKSTAFGIAFLGICAIGGGVGALTSTPYGWVTFGALAVVEAIVGYLTRNRP